jgi:hypothetical protein
MSISEKAADYEFLRTFSLSDADAISREEKKGVNEPGNVSTNIR